MREICSCFYLTVLPGPAWLLLNKIDIPLFWALYGEQQTLGSEEPTVERGMAVSPSPFCITLTRSLPSSTTRRTSALRSLIQPRRRLPSFMAPFGRSDGRGRRTHRRNENVRVLGATPQSPIRSSMSRSLGRCKIFHCATNE